MGFVGVAILVGPTILGQTGALDPLGLAALIISPIAWSLGSLYASHRATLPRQPLVATARRCSPARCVLAVLMAGVTGEFGRFDAAAISSDSIGALVYLTVIGSLLAFTAYGWLLRVAPLPLIATYAYVNPVVAVILGALRPPRADRPPDARGGRRDHRRGRAHRDRTRPDDGAGVQAVGRSQPWAGHGSHLSGRSSR